METPNSDLPAGDHLAHVIGGAPGPMILGDGTSDLIDYVESRIQPTTVRITDPNGQVAPIDMIALPDGKGLALQPLRDLLNPFRLRPERRTGTAKLETLASLIDFANRFKNEHSALYAMPIRQAPSMQVVINYHRLGADGQAEFGDHRGTYAFPLSDEWKAWIENDGKAMDQQKFAEFLEDRITDVIQPPAVILARQSGQDIGAAMPDRSDAEKAADQKLMDLLAQLGTTIATASKLLELSRGMAVHSTGKVKNVVNLQSGAAEIVFIEEHVGEDGNKLVVPGLFLIGIPVFLQGQAYRIPVRLRYRKQEGKLIWFYQIHRPDLQFDDAFSGAATLAQAQTGLPLFFGTPEQAATAGPSPR